MRPMRRGRRVSPRPWAALCWAVRSGLLSLLLAGLAPAQAHLMVAQQGTLNFSGDGAYLLLSLPVSALAQVDDNGDGLLSQDELRAHSPRIAQQVQAQVQLMDGKRPLDLQSLMFNLAPPDESPTAPANQLVVMGRYALPPDLPEARYAALTFRLGLWGRAPAEQAHDLRFTRGTESRAARLSPEQTTVRVLAPAAAVLADYARLGLVHVLSGWDHLVFLLLVLLSMASARFNARTLLLTLSSFTVGHGITLLASVKGWLVVSPALVEPAIAATILGFALLELWQRRQARPMSAAWRCALVFACALVHGLGLASALGGLGGVGQDLSDLLLALAGFNTGIELAQLSVVAAALLALAAAKRVTSPKLAQALAPKLACVCALMAMGVGSWWLVERLPV